MDPVFVIFVAYVMVLAAEIAIELLTVAHKLLHLLGYCFLLGLQGTRALEFQARSEVLCVTKQVPSEARA